MNDIKEILRSNDYDFLRDNKNLKDNIILLTLGGSHSYGTNTKNSDLDIRGVVTNTKEEILTMNCRYKPYEDKGTDTVIYTLNQIRQLLYNGNPNILEMFGTRDEDVFIINEHGKTLRDNIDLFLSRRVIKTFGGYAASQLRRIQNTLGYEDDKEKHTLRSITDKIASMNEEYEAFDKGNMNFYLDNNKICMDVSLKNYPLRDFKNIYSEIYNIVKSYGRLNHRNKKKDADALNKHAMHLIRLLVMGTEILEGKGINTYREDDKDLLLDIRNGKVPMENIFELVDIYEENFQYAAKNTTLPKTPDVNKTNDLIMEINKSIILESKKSR